MDRGSDTKKKILSRKLGFYVRIAIGTQYIGQTVVQKVYLLGSSAPKLFLPLVQSSIAVVYLMKAMFGEAWAVAVSPGDDMDIR